MQESKTKKDILWIHRNCFLKGSSVALLRFFNLSAALLYNPFFGCIHLFGTTRNRIIFDETAAFFCVTASAKEFLQMIHT